jgi:glyoxylase-like metal-dependent hydrolase (beta-lactamase superfamily II)
MTTSPLIHRYPAEYESAFVNAYLVETDAGIVAVDSLLTVSEARRMRAALEGIGKPLHAVLLTQSHPDHYGGLRELVARDDVPIIAPQGVIDTIVRDDEEKEQILRPMFGDEWAASRTFPNTAIRDGESVTFDGISFTVIDLGPSESPHDSPWVLGDDDRTVFLGDQIYDRRHCFLADGFYRQWLPISRFFANASRGTPSSTSATAAPSARMRGTGSGPTSRRSSARSRQRAGRAPSRRMPPSWPR